MTLQNNIDPAECEQCGNSVDDLTAKQTPTSAHAMKYE